MLPGNTSVVVFPIVSHYAQLARVLNPYRTVVDVVDNQFSWASNERRRQELASQYGALIASGDAIVFNSHANVDFFVDQGLLRREDPRVAVIPNWYRLPRGFVPPEPKEGRPLTFAYTGNMNDRVDWAVLAELADEFPEARLLMIGAAARVGESLDALLLRPNVAFLGALEEQECLRVLSGVDVAVMPHVHNDVSAYMNPLKLKMYEALGLPTVVTQVSGTDDVRTAQVTAARDQFVESVRKVLAQTPAPGTGSPASEPGGQDEEQRYLSVLTGVRAAGRRSKGQMGRRIT
jgi:glycosyltransferase involved in cell wall biosynthesis